MDIEALTTFSDASSDKSDGYEGDLEKIKYTWYRKIAEGRFGALAVCCFGSFIIAFMLSPAIVYSIILDGQYMYAIKPYGCTTSSFTGNFPEPVKDFYKSSE